MAFLRDSGKNPAVEIIGVPLGYGAARHGTRFGPDAVRAARLHDAIAALGYEVRDIGNVAVPESAGPQAGGPNKPRHVSEIRSACGATADAVEQALRSGAFPLIIGGDHSLAIGALAGAARAKGMSGVVWIDAHADMNTPATSPTGNLH